MILVPPPVFAFDEADHLTRIHLKIGLEDLGFVVVEADGRLALFDDPPPAALQPSATGL